MDPSESHHKQGHVLAGRYEILAEIGRGGFGMVYRARQLNMDREVAIKVLPPQFMAIADVVERFKREAKLTSQLTHPNTITIHDYGQSDDLLFIVMELLDGEDLADVLKRERTLPLERILHIAQHILKSLAEAHQKGIVHRDLKPENIFLCPTSEGDEIVKVLDFGIAKLAQPDGSSLHGKQLTITGSTVGTPVYMSPEQAAGEEVDHLTDLYALGIMIYEMACGTPPFHDQNPVKVMRSHLFSEIPPFPDTSTLSGTYLERVVMRMLQKEKNLRYQNARELLGALDASKPVITALPSSLLSSRLSSVPPEEEDDLPTIELLDTSDAEEFALIPSTGDHKAQNTNPYADVIPFDGLLSRLDPPSRARIRHDAPTRPPLTDPASSEGFDAHGLNTSSAILSIIEHAPAVTPAHDEEVFLLTRPKTSSSTSHIARQDMDIGKGQQAPTSLGSVAKHVQEEGAPGLTEGEGWSWDPHVTPETHRVDSGAYPQLKQKQAIQKKDTTSSSRIPMILAVIVLALGAVLLAFYMLIWR